jgi:hypothetical protein
MSTKNAIHPLESLEDYLEAVQSNYDACLGHCDHRYKIDGVDATIRLHYVKFNKDSTPKFDVLAKCLVEHISFYCISACKRPTEVTLTIANRLFMQARDMFRKIDTAGETGELLLYFLLETVLKAPQVVCKMELKTNPADEVKGGDGIHVSYTASSDTLNVYLGESKLHAHYSNALTDAFKSMETLHSLGPREHELNLVTSHFKYFGEDIQAKIAEYLDETTPGGNLKIKHACLIGYDWSEYEHLATDGRDLFIKEFEPRFVEHVQALVKKTKKLFTNFTYRNLSYEFFFLPFKDVQEFRDVFYEYLNGKRA